MNNSVWEKRRKRLFELIEIGSNYDAWCWGYDFFNTFTILLNLTVSIMYTFDNMEMKYGPLLLTLERLTVAFFAIDFLLRVFTAKTLFPESWICCPLFRTICRFSSHPVQSHSVCCESSVFSGCSASMLITIH